MKTKLLLFISITLIIAAIVTIVILSVSLNKANRQKKGAELTRDQIASKLTSMLTAKKIGAIDEKEIFYRRDFASHADGKLDSYLLVPPMTPAKDNLYTLIVYLHGMGSNYLEPYVVANKEPIGPAIKAKYPDSVLISLNYRQKNAWGNDKALADISQNILEVSQAYPINKIILIGTSMGGCVALNYAAVAPEQIKKKITGVVSVEGSGDLRELYRITKIPVIKLGIADAMGGPPETSPKSYDHASLLANIEQLPKGIKFSIVSAKSDTTVPPALQKKVFEELQKHGNECQIVDIDLGHEFPTPETYIKSLEFVF